MPLSDLLSSLSDDKTDAKTVAGGFADVIKDFDAKGDAAVKERDAAMSPYLAEGKKLSEQIGALEGRISSIKTPKAPDLKELPTAPDSQFKDPTQALGGLGSLIAIIGSLATRQPAIAALNAGAAAMQGFHKGDQERVKLEREKAQDQMQRALHQNQQELAEYNAALQAANFDMGKAQAEFTGIAAKHNDLNMRATIESGNFSAQWQLLQQRAGLTEKAVTFIGQMKDREEARKAREAQVKQAHEDRQAQMAQTKELALMRIQAAGGVDAFAGKKGELLAAMAEQGVSLPAGLRSKAQQVATLQSLVDRNPDLSADEIVNKIKSGQIDLSNLKTEGRVAAGIAGKVAYAEQEIQQTVPLVQEASKRVPREQFVPFNKLRNMSYEQLSNPELKELKVYLTSLSNAYDLLAARGGTDKDKRAHNRELFDTADSPEALNRVLDAIQNEARVSGVAAERSMKPGAGAPVAGAAWTPDKEKRYQELKARATQ